MESALRLLIVDDSKLMRDALVGIFADDENIMIETASDGFEALALLDVFKPDVITLDINMPELDGISTLKRIMIDQPVPTIMLSSLAQEGAKITFDALRYGAVDFISKPSAISDISLEEQKQAIRSRVEYAAKVELGAIKYIRHKSGNEQTKADFNNNHCHHLVALGAAEGGYGALLKIIPQLSSSPGVAYLVSLHVPTEFVDAFIGYLNSYSQVEVKHAAHNEVIKPGCCYISSGDNYMSVHSELEDYVLHISSAPFINRRGAIDMLFFSTAESIKDHAVGVILSGLGEDGAEGLEEIIRVGGTALAQDPSSCLCNEMVEIAMSRSQVAIVETDSRIAAGINKLVN
ncbi:MAG: response regulator [Gammaproteobacteria bacterium]|nr:response regulator [Gammaproteobacteria bacterium]